MTHLPLEAIRDLYESGLTQREVGARLGFDQSSISHALKRAGVPSRRPVVTAEQRAELVRRYEAGEPVATILSATSLCESVMYRALHKDKIPLRKRALTEDCQRTVILMYQEGYSFRQISRLVGESVSRVAVALANAGVEKRPRHHLRRESPGFSGGRRLNKDGYVLALSTAADARAFPSMAMKSGYTLKHRMVMAKWLGRGLFRWETVHHRNGKRDDNRIENLELRNGPHGPGCAMCCAECGSINLVPQEAVNDAV